MKVKCIKNFIKNNETVVINNDMRDYLVIGQEYWVYGLRFHKNKLYMFLFDNEHILEVPSEFFEIIDETININWKVKKWDENDVTIWPELFYKEEFLENFSERELLERALFTSLQMSVENKNQ